MVWLNLNTEIELAKYRTIKQEEGLKKVGLYRTAMEGNSKIRKSDWSITIYH